MLNNPQSYSLFHQFIFLKSTPALIGIKWQKNRYQNYLRNDMSDLIYDLMKRGVL
jgi:hypothetical protein